MLANHVEVGEAETGQLVGDLLTEPERRGYHLQHRLRQEAKHSSL